MTKDGALVCERLPAGNYRYEPESLEDHRLANLVLDLIARLYSA
jgi:hypothetical protein